MDEVVKSTSGDFEQIIGMIKEAQLDATRKANEILINLYWKIGQYVSEKISNDGWGHSTVKELSEYVLSKVPGAKGYSDKNIWRMKQFYETYKDQPDIIPLLRSNTWTNNLCIIAKCKTNAERVFYLRISAQEHYSSRELERQIDSCYYERLALSDGKAPSGLEEMELVEKSSDIRDNYMLEFLNLPSPYKEHDVKRAILENMKNFILEFGRDFIFMGEEYHVQVGNHDFYIDLLFYHRGLQCLVAFELKIDEFKAEYLGKMGLYLEALDRDVRKSNENPSIGIILCKGKDQDVVEYAMSKSISQTKIAEYSTQLIDKAILQKKLDELYDIAEDAENIDKTE